MLKLLPTVKEADLYQASAQSVPAAAQPKGGFTVAVDAEGVYSVKGRRVEKLIAMTNFNQPDSWDRLHRIFKTIGMDKALKKTGCAAGDMVRVGNKEFQWTDETMAAGRPGKFAYKYRRFDQEYGD